MVTDYRITRFFGGSNWAESVMLEAVMKRTPKKVTRSKTAPVKPQSRELESQLAKGRDFMKKYANTFRALAK
jgi:hypothetical protein